jgi:hypothetical protein
VTGPTGRFPGFDAASQAGHWDPVTAGATRTPTRSGLIRSAATARSSCAAPAPAASRPKVGPVAIANGRFGNRPHCIYRGFCLQGCKGSANPALTIMAVAARAADRLAAGSR